MTVRTYYVNASTGSDSNDGSSGSPWLTIAYAMSNAAWSGADGIVFVLSGTFTLTSVVSETNPNTYTNCSVVFCAATLGAARIIHNHTGQLVGDFAYRRILWKRMEIEFASTGAWAFGLRASFCKFIFSRSSNTTYSPGGGIDVRDSEFDCTGGTIGTHIYLTLTTGVHFQRCKFTGIKSISLPAANTNVYFEHCRFVKCGRGVFPAIDSVSTTGMTLTTSLSHLSFVECGSSASGAVFSMTGRQTLRDCVFQDNYESCASISSSSKITDLTRIYHYGTGSIGSPEAIGDTPVTGTLASKPYADPVNNDWTVSAELAAIVGSDGLTPGAVQSSGGGNPMLAFQHGFYIGRSGAL